MLIANPIYDTVFKHLLENTRVAKFFISTLLGKTVHSITLRSPEHTYIDPRDKELKLLRLDFTVEIEEADGKRKKIIIEMQKADKYSADITRFRKYLGYEYMSDSLPITSIYVLGFNLPGIDTACLRIGRDYYDLIDEKEIKASANFVESLTHECYIVQTPRITGRLKTPLDKLLSVFEQANFTDQTGSDKSYKHPVDDENVKAMLDILHYLSTDPEARKELEDERYYREYVEDTFGDLYLKIEEQTQRLATAENKLEEEAKKREEETKKRAVAEDKLTEQAAEIAELKKKLEKYEK